MTRLTFSPGNHAYYLLDPVTGRKSRPASVTALLKLLGNEGLKRWASRTAAEFAADHWDELAALTPSKRITEIAAAPWQKRDRAAASGTAIHAMAEQLLAGQPVEVPDEIAPKVEAVARWLERNPIGQGMAECRVWSDADDELGMCAYAGTADLLGVHPRHGRLLLDWKSGSGVYPEMAVQLAAYASAENLVIDGEDRPMPDLDTLAIAHVTPDGVDLHVVDHESRARALARFELLRMLRALEEPALSLEVA